MTKTSVCRGVAKFIKDGAAAFYAAPGRRKGPVMTPEVLTSAQELLDDGFSRLEAFFMESTLTLSSFFSKHPLFR